MPSGNLPATAIPEDLGAFVQVAAGSVLAQMGILRADIEKKGLMHVREIPIIQGLAALSRDPNNPLRQEVEVECSQGCGTRYRCMRFLSEQTSCDACREKADEVALTEYYRGYWHSVCPEGLRDTNKDHENFPHGAYEELSPKKDRSKWWTGDESLFFYGDNRTGKTRLAMLMLKRAMLKGKTIGVLWPWDFEALRGNNRDATQLMKETYGNLDVLLMDDVLLTGARDERLSGWLKNLLDFMLNHNRRWIVTSNIGGDDYLEQAKKFTEGGKLSATDEARIKGLLSRLRENSRVIPFNRAVPVAGETAF